MGQRFAHAQLSYPDHLTPLACYVEGDPINLFCMAYTRPDASLKLNIFRWLFFLVAFAEKQLI